MNKLGKSELSKMRKEEILNYAQESVIEHLKSYIGEEITGEYLIEFIKELNINGATRDNEDLINEYTNQFYLGGDSLALEEHIILIDNVIEDATNDELLEDEDLEIIIATASVAKNSHAYWLEHSDEWFSLLNELRLEPGYQDRIIDADIKGAVIGAIGGTVGGGPVGGLLGGLLSSSLSSAWSGIEEYLT